jgi:apolipoprotein N-acyltransferase
MVFSSAKLWKLAILGSVLLGMSFPPLDWWLLAWIAPVPWVFLIRRKQLDGRRPYRTLAAAGFVFWMGVLHWLRLPHWATSFGWIALSFYFAFYLPMFVGLSRTAVHRLRVPVILAAPTVWTGLELARAHLLTGMSMGSLAHTQYRWISLIQVSDLAGEYGVCFVVMFVAASLARMIPCDERPRAFWPLIPALGMLGAVLGYGWLRATDDYVSPGMKVALIQGSIDIELTDDPDSTRRDRIFDEYFGLSVEAIQKHPKIDLVVWPESMFVCPLVTYDPDAKMPEDYEGTEAEFRRALPELAENGPALTAQMAKRLDAPLLLGANTYHLGADGEKCHNSAVYVGRDGKIAGRYDKTHLVMFGEYMPLVEYLPWLQYCTPLTGNATPGDKFESFGAGRVRVAPSICYEDVLSHVIRRQVNALAAEGREPDVLINLTNDGWFWGSSELDMHLICAVFRAVECRKPFLIAANTGFSAWIDSDGRIVQKGPRRATQVLIAEPRLDASRRSWYLEQGDWFAGFCLLLCLIFGVLGMRPPRKS